MKYGQILEVQLIRDNMSGKSKGCAFVKFESMTEGDAAIQQLVNTTLDGVYPLLATII